MPCKLKHNFEFEPDYGYKLVQLKALHPNDKPRGFKGFWQGKYQQALQIKSHVSIENSHKTVNNWRIFKCFYNSTKHLRCGAWLLLPSSGVVDSAIISAHGYGGIEQVDCAITLNNTAVLMPCSRGIGLSPKPPISDNPMWHVLHNIQDKQRYVIGGCVQDLWCGVSALLDLFPQVNRKLGLIGSSFGGGLGIFASAFDSRIQRAHFHVPTFGNVPLRLKLPTLGSGAALASFYQQQPKLALSTLRYFDSATAATYLRCPSHWALALFDPHVAPPGQFTAYNQAPQPKQLFVLSAGHFDYPEKQTQQQQLNQQLASYFAELA
ncbi:deacetylase [Agarivorans sp. Toyoura001]|uniref:acetylxylan esterase n=1 Tax=Agarivorans sp. Toyoura001 TaxID=2283141 RepID=UPI0010D01C2F|nr:acetylxylan esterase [Agarivorans sp. Toyoura001]GDY27873.1 deacetylase [Agarivorans sp. Toyoura001]